MTENELLLLLRARNAVDKIEARSERGMLNYSTFLRSVRDIFEEEENAGTRNNALELLNISYRASLESRQDHSLSGELHSPEEWRTELGRVISLYCYAPVPLSLESTESSFHQPLLTSKHLTNVKRPLPLFFVFCILVFLSVCFAIIGISTREKKNKIVSILNQQENTDLTNKISKSGAKAVSNSIASLNENNTLIEDDLNIRDETTLHPKQEVNKTIVYKKNNSGNNREFGLQEQEKNLEQSNEIEFNKESMSMTNEDSNELDLKNKTVPIELHVPEEIDSSELKVDKGKDAIELDLPNVTDLACSVQKLKNGEELEIKLQREEVVGHIRFIRIPGGEYTMNGAEQPKYKFEVPQYYISEIPIQQNEWRILFDEVSNTQLKIGKPKTNITHEEAGNFCQELKNAISKSKENSDIADVRLPWSYEWEYAFTKRSDSIGESLRQSEWVQDFFNKNLPYTSKNGKLPKQDKSNVSKIKIHEIRLKTKERRPSPNKGHSDQELGFRIVVQPNYS